MTALKSPLKTTGDSAPLEVVHPALRQRVLDVQTHYDLSDDFFRLFLDPTLVHLPSTYMLIHRCSQTHKTDWLSRLADERRSASRPGVMPRTRPQVSNPAADCVAGEWLWRCGWPGGHADRCERPWTPQTTVIVGSHTSVEPSAQVASRSRCRATTYPPDQSAGPGWSAGRLCYQQLC
jgi:hypothetical protein